MEQSSHINLDEFGIPGLEVIIGAAILGLGTLHVHLAVLDHHRKDTAGDVRERNGAVGKTVLDHVLDRLQFQRHDVVHFERHAIGAHQVHLPRRHLSLSLSLSLSLTLQTKRVKTKTLILTESP